MRCIECPAEATVQVVSAWGAPLAAFCTPCWEAEQAGHDALMAMLRDAVAAPAV